jgi:hypothetical protein
LKPLLSHCKRAPSHRKRAPVMQQGGIQGPVAAPRQFGASGSVPGMGQRLRG